jgi:chromatin segregation and condensation protein Rec8/ScpA/Scc1 (kleisin family)
VDEEPVEILVGLAERGEIDPWNIDILEVTDRFLGELDRRRELDLRVSGRTLFYAATLLRLKSEFLVEPEEAVEGDELGLEEEPPEGFDIHEPFGPIERLEREIKLAASREEIPLGELCLTLDRKIADVYIPLLFLNLDGKIEISQETFFEEVYIKRVEGGKKGEK